MNTVLPLHELVKEKVDAATCLLGHHFIGIIPQARQNTGINYHKANSSVKISLFCKIYLNIYIT